MSSIKKIVIAVSMVVMVSAFVSPVKAAGMDSPNWPTQVTFNAPVQIGNLVLVPGTYELQLTNGTVARNVVAIYSVDRECWVGMVMGINVERVDTSKMSGFTFKEIGVGSPQALEYWFHANWNRGIKFLNPRTRNADNMIAAIAPSAR